jgi:hypothetical protein
MILQIRKQNLSTNAVRRTHWRETPPIVFTGGRAIPSKWTVYMSRLNTSKVISYGFFKVATHFASQGVTVGQSGNDISKVITSGEKSWMCDLSSGYCESLLVLVPSW